MPIVVDPSTSSRVSLFGGIIFPERVLRKHVDLILKEIQTDTVLLEELLKTEDTPRRDSIINVITQRGIKTVLGFPRTQFETPCVVVTLMSGDEDTVLADEFDINVADDSSVTAALQTVLTVNEKLPKTVTISPVSGIFPAQGIIRIDEESFSYDAVTSTSMRLVHRGILNTAKAAHTLNATIMRNLVTRIQGSYERMSLRVDVLDDTADMTIFLGQLIKVGLRGNMLRLAKDGLFEVTMTSSDFAQLPEHIPQHIYNRTIMVNCRYELTLPEVLDSLTDLFATNETPAQPNIGGGPGNTLVLSN